MASFKVNYAGLRKAQGKNEAPKNFSEPAIASNQPVSSQPAIASRISSKVNSTTSKQDAGFLSPYQGSFHTDNMDYINLLLKNKQSSTKDNKSPTESKKKGHDRNKPSLGDFNQKQPPLQLQSNSPQSNRQLVAVPVNSVEENDKPTSMRPDEDDGFQIIKSKEIKKPVKLIQEPDREEFYEGDDTQRNVVYSPAPFGGRIFERFAKEEGAARRSMSVEDIRLEKKALIMNHNKSTLHDPAELGSYFERSPEKSAHESKHSNMSPKGDFLSNLGGFIDYFHKSENVSYRNMKAGQYLKGNIGKNQRLIQKDLDVAIHELNVRKNQIQELKSTINEILRENKLLKKELKSVHIREQEQHQIFQKMQAEINHLKEKNQHYKSKFMQTKELLGHERSENENNLLSLKQVLANINIALEQRTSPFRNATKEKQSQLKNVLVDSLFLKKNRENLPRQYTKDKGRLNGIIEGYNSIYETGNHRRSIEHKGHKRDSSMLLSQKDSLLSSEEPSDSLSSNQFSNSNKYDNSEEDYQNQGHYQDSYRQSISKNQQIRFLQEKLTELMGNEDITYHSHTPNAKMGIKTSRAKKPYHRRNVSDVGVTNYYMSRERQGSIGKHANPLSKYSPKEQRSRMMHGEYQETPSANVTERSFSVHESQEITE